MDSCGDFCRQSPVRASERRCGGCGRWRGPGSWPYLTAKVCSLRLCHLKRELDRTMAYIQDMQSRPHIPSPGRVGNDLAGTPARCQDKGTPPLFCSRISRPVAGRAG